MSASDTREIAAALGRSAEVRLADGASSPDAAHAAIAEAPDEVVLKALEPHTGPRETLDDLAGGAQFGPWPPSLVFIARAGDAGAVALTTVPLRGDPVTVSANIVNVETSAGAFDWYRPKAKRVGPAKAEEPRPAKHWAELVAELDAGGEARRLVLAFAVAATEDEARAALAPLERAVASWARGEPVDPPAQRAPARALTMDTGAARLAWSREGEVIVLRDFANPGPARYAAAYRTTSIVSLAVAVALAGSIAIQAAAGAPVGALIGTGAVAAVLLVNAFAFFQIAGFARRYASESLALAWFGDDRVVVGPWLSRYGAVDMRPSGRLGAAIPTAEVNGVGCFDRGGAHAVEMASEHGPFEIVRAPTAALAEDIKRVTDALLETVAAPRKRPKKGSAAPA
ncbi:MAG: hypothetical protein U0414_25695 [Polyangiaceae bacterium]